MSSPVGDPASGLSAAEARTRLEREGFNELPASGRRPGWRIAAEVIREPMFALLIAAAVIYAALGDKDKAFVELEKAFDEHDYLLPRINVEPFLDPLRDDPRFKDLARRIGL